MRATLAFNVLINLLHISKSLTSSRLLGMRLIEPSPEAATYSIL